MDNNIKEKNFLSKQIFFKKYKIIQSLSPGINNFVFEGINITTKTKVAIKIQNKITGRNTLLNEGYLLFLLKGYGIREYLVLAIKENIM